ncbi:lytic murein transglycosylase [Aliiroseovarius crassostreae]|uniref:lytic murein transglycosylase n=1 Tax=Aliiroseovarius crassostreae TaxID=154981 RepID=UPI00220EB9CF|nr:lytic murein transglycosylase [Aliiroseovarius crassostreae]UWQ01170.1 lytic murein transglycosylase [Aliiroseovarius crassostreae]
MDRESVMVSRRVVLTGLMAMSALPHVAGAEAGFRAWLSGFGKSARRAGIKSAILKQLDTVAYLPKVVAADRKPAETAKSLDFYISSAASSSRIRTGKSMARRYSGLLEQLERRYGVSRYVLLAIWGMESSYGGFRGNVPTLSALASLAYEGRRRERFEAELLAALKILQAGDVTPKWLVGSYAGAMGHTQFMPSSYLEHAVDFDRNGRRDIWGDDPTDALASTAAFLAAKGWSKGPRWGEEVRLPQGFDLALTGRIYPRKQTAWAQLGVTRANGRKLSGRREGAVILPAGPEGPVFMIYPNFHIIKTYNYADSYAISVGHLADRIAGEGAFLTRSSDRPWGMSLKERVELQNLLNTAGYNAGRADGVIGEKGRAAIRAYEKAHGLRQTGVPSRALLARLR